MSLPRGKSSFGFSFSTVSFFFSGMTLIRGRVVPFGAPARVALLAYLDKGRSAMLPRQGAVAQALFFNRRRKPMTARDVRGMLERSRVGVAPQHCLYPRPLQGERQPELLWPA